MNKDRLLIVEDDANLGQILKEYLEAKGYDTTLCRDGELGISTFRDQDFDLCILDIMMPKKDGFTVAKEIRQIDKQTPIIFLTAKSMKEDTIEGLKIGADDYITKPFSMEELFLKYSKLNRFSQKQLMDFLDFLLGKEGEDPRHFDPKKYKQKLKYPKIIMKKIMN